MNYKGLLGVALKVIFVFACLSLFSRAVDKIIKQKEIDAVNTSLMLCHRACSFLAYNYDVEGCHHACDEVHREELGKLKSFYK